MVVGLRPTPFCLKARGYVDDRLRRPALKVCAQPHGQPVDGVPPPTACPHACTQTHAFDHIPTGNSNSNFAIAPDSKSQTRRLSLRDSFSWRPAARESEKGPDQKILINQRKFKGGYATSYCVPLRNQLLRTPCVKLTPHCVIFAKIYAFWLRTPTQHITIFTQHSAQNLQLML